MYKIIGGDQKEYGPASAEEMRRWIEDGRLNGQTLVLADGSTEWKPLATYPEFADALRTQSSKTSTGPSPIGLLTPHAWSAQILARQPEVQVGSCLARAWDLLLANFGLIFSATFLVWSVGLIQFVPAIGILYLFIQGVLYGGLYLVILNRVRGQPAFTSQVFQGFGPSFAQLMLAGFLTYFLSSLGFIFCILPGIYLLVAWVFSVPLVADKRLEFWSAMELSRKTVTRIWFPMFGLMLLAFTPYILTCVVAQIKITLSMYSAVMGTLGPGQPDIASMVKAMKQVIEGAFPLILMEKVVLLLNLPFAVAALMYAYEDIFGARPPRRP